MPVTIKPSPELVGHNLDNTVTSARQILQSTYPRWYESIQGTEQIGRGNYPDTRVISNETYPLNLPVIQSSFDDLGGSIAIAAYGNGFVDGILRAFQQDLHLVLRPDDVWLSILTQFSQYVKGNSEQLRKHFVNHDGQNDLVLGLPSNSLRSLDMAKCAQAFTRLIHENVVDPELRAWILPNFTTTTNEDLSVASVVMMATLQNYFRYTMWIGCGFPSVTLEGEKSDWEEILDRIRKLPKYGEETMEWTVLLTPILKNVIQSFEQPDSQATRDFWLRACHAGGRDGSTTCEYLSGWLTAFCFWDQKGKRTHNIPEASLKQMYGEKFDGNRLVLNNIAYPIIPVGNIPSSIVNVPMTVTDLETHAEYKTRFFAGCMGMTPSKNGTTVQPRSGWILLQESVKPTN